MTGVAQPPRLAFIGAGRAGRALGSALHRAGYPVVAVASRTEQSAERMADALPGARAFHRAQDAVDAAEIVFLTVPDDALAALVAELRWRSEGAAVHCSGALSLDPLEPARVRGAEIGGFHPLQTLAGGAEDVGRFAGITVGIEADSERFRTDLERMARAIGGTPLRLGPGDKALYHASGVFACNYLVTLVDVASSLWEAFGVERADAVRALLPLIRATVGNIEDLGVARALTGPVARGDAGTVARHRRALSGSAPGEERLYSALARRTAALALEGGALSAERAQRVLTALEDDGE
jgi:predicted short-subunit dehydrogenase-like oxidoreductase (DUF2520 family)